MAPAFFRAVIFDMDGLMLDTESISRSTWKKAGEDLGYGFTDALFERLIGRTGPDCEAVIREVWGADFPFGPMYERSALHWERETALRGIPQKPGLVELMEFCDIRGIRKAVATSSRRDNALKKLGALAAQFEVLVTGDEVVRGKPFPDIFLLAARRLGLSPGQCLVLEDSIAGIQAAEAAQMYAIMVPDLLPPTDRVAHVCASLHEVQAWMKERLDLAERS